MEHVKELLQSRIEEIHDPVQRVLLQDVLIDVFGELLRYSDRRFAGLEKKLDNEIQDFAHPYYIYTGVCKREHIDNTSRCLFEMDMGKEYGKGYLGKLFLACAYPSICNYLKHTYNAKVYTSQGDYETVVSLGYCREYIRVIENLYRQFNKNQKQWHTINCPFIYKLLAVSDIKGIVPEDADVQKVELLAEGLENSVINDVAFVWNVKEEIYKTRAWAAPAGKEEVYIHEIMLEDTEAGYLAVPEEEFFQTVFSQDSLYVHTRKKEYQNIKLLKIACMDADKDLTGLIYPLQTNKRQMRHADRQALSGPRCLCTKGEIERIISSYEISDEFELIDVCMDLQGTVPALDMNPFIKSHSLLKPKRKITLILHPKDSTDIFKYEKMFFLIAELQLYTDEYEWTGVLRD
ncbi:MAG: hypothetical protein HFH68_13390 [Lachnospiraceae bacterium]|nr:hypothetical protein [Lachnospiraceae bacterium]